VLSVVGWLGCENRDAMSVRVVIHIGFSIEVEGDNIIELCHG
jgi:hypothetical protein